jgi:hypothetical protein
MDRALYQYGRLGTAVMSLKDLVCLLWGTAPKYFQFGIALFHFYATDDAGYPFLGQGANPHINPVTVARARALEVAIVKRVAKVRKAGMSRPLGTIYL